MADLGSRSANVDLFLLLGDRRQAEHGPLLRRFPDQSANQIILMQPLHDNNDGTGPLVVETRHDGVEEGVVDTFAPAVRQRINWFERIVDDDDVPAPAGEGTLDRGG